MVRSRQTHRGKQERRGKVKRERARFIILGFEGKNKTEYHYFKHFNRLQKRYILKFAPENATDPYHVVDSVSKWIHKQKGKEAFDPKSDYAYAVFDTDTDIKREDQIKTAKEYAKQNGIQVLLSSPCFELWYILHFTDRRAAYSSNDAVIRELRKYISGYEKNTDVFDKVFPGMSEAIDRAKKLRQYHEEWGHTRYIERNPSSDVDQLVEMLMRKDK